MGLLHKLLGIKESPKVEKQTVSDIIRKSPDIKAKYIQFGPFGPPDNEWPLWTLWSTSSTIYNWDILKDEFSDTTQVTQWEYQNLQKYD